MPTTETPERFIARIEGKQREFCRQWPNQQTITVQGAHFLQEEVPQLIGETTARFIAKVLAGQIARAAA